MITLTSEIVMNPEIESLLEASTDLTMSVNSANRLLSSSIIAYLVDKGIVDIEDYITHTDKVKKYLLDNREFGSDREKYILDSTFDLHINDLKKHE